MAADNEKLAMRYLEGINQGNAAIALDIFSDDSKIWIAGNDMTKAELANMLSLVKTLFVKGPELVCTHVFSTDDKVALEMKVTGESRKGVQYKNNYCLIFTFRNGKVTKFNEYLDTAPATAALF